MGLSLFKGFLVLVFGFIFLIKGAGWFVDGSVGIAKKLRFSQLFIALTVVAMGTSIPETAVSILSAIKGNQAISIGNIIGTNTFNILLIMGITSIIRPLYVQHFTVRFEILIVIGAAIVFGFLGFGPKVFIPAFASEGYFSRIDGGVMLILFFGYLLYLWKLAKKISRQNELCVIEPQKKIRSIIFMLVTGLFLVILGSVLTIRGALRIARNLGVSERFIGLTIVAIGTSLPELSTSIVAAVKKHNDIALGNIIGSNIYNMLFIGGMVALIRPVSFSSKFCFDCLVCIASTVLLLILIKTDSQKRITRFAGILMILFYAIYFAWMLNE